MNKRYCPLCGFLSIFASLALVLASNSVKAGDKPMRGENPKVQIAVRKGADQERRNFAVSQHHARLDEQRYEGLLVKPHPDAAGEALELQRRISKLLAMLDFVPDHRANHFRWMKNYPIVHTGWEGRIDQTTRIDGGFLVKVRVYPKHTGGVDVVNDHVIEYYYYSRGRLQYVKSEDDPAPKVTSFN